MTIYSIYKKCLKRIGGISNPDVHWYLNERPKIITRKSFIEAVIFAVWASGMSRVSASSFLERADDNGFSWNYEDISSSSKKEWSSFLVSMHGKSVPPKACEKWNAIQSIAELVSTFDSEKDFRKLMFQGKYKSIKLDKTDVMALRKMKLPYIGPANCQFVIRNMGGEAIKCDRWVKAFMEYHDLTHSYLISYLKKKKLPEGLFDLVIWAYCEMHVKEVKNFNEHFSENFA